MSQSLYRRFLNRGRKAGLTTTDLYRALSSRSPVGGASAIGRTDCNGYIAQIGANGQRTFGPLPPKS